MKSHSYYSTSLCLLGALTFGACDEPIAAVDGPIVTPAELGLGDDWTEIETGLWTRTVEGAREYVGIGAAGQQHALASLERAEDDLLHILAVEEREETRSQLEQLEAIITDLRVTEMTPEADPALRCVPMFSASVDAYPSSCGVSAKASASYSHCQYSGSVRTYAQATCGYETKTHQCGYKSGTSVTCSSMISITGSSPCKSYSYAEISAPNVYAYVWDENVVRGTCTPPPPPLCNCPIGKSCSCGDNVCRPNNSLCP